jgi:ribosomal protein S18 acetylase RimI-like enzyme
MNDGEEGPITLKLVSISEKKDFLAMYMSHRMEIMSFGIEHGDQGRDDQLSRFWNDPDTNYLIWVHRDGKNIGFAAVSVIEQNRGKLLDLGIFREHRGKEIGKIALQEVLRFSKYRGLKRLEIGFNKAPERILKFFEESGFERDGMNLKLDL